MFFPPELAGQIQFEEFESVTANRQSELMRQTYFKRLHSNKPDVESDRMLVALILNQAKRVIAHPARPTRLKTKSFINEPQSELAIEETLEETPVLDDANDLLVESREEKPFSCVLILDTSSSMSGDKHLLASIAVAVLVLKMPAKDFSIVVFSSEAKSIKKLYVEEQPENVVLKFLKHQPRGFTNVGLGLEAGLGQLKTLGQGRRKIGLIATDGRTTEGKDPIEVAKQFDFLVVLHLSGAGGDLETSRMMAQAGHGVCLEVEKFEDLPKKLYEALRVISRR